jgi:hypothetical protein
MYVTRIRWALTPEQRILPGQGERTEHCAALDCDVRFATKHRVFEHCDWEGIPPLLVPKSSRSVKGSREHPFHFRNVASSSNDYVDSAFGRSDNFVALVHADILTLAAVSKTSPDAGSVGRPGGSPPRWVWCQTR